LLRFRNLLAAVPLAASLALPAQAVEEDWGLCSLPTFRYLEADDLAEGETRIEANEVVSDDNETLHLVGAVSLTRRQLKLDADDVLLKKQSQQIDARGNVVLQQPDFRIAGPHVEIDRLADTVSMNDAAFELPGRHARGTAGKIDKLDSYRSRFENLFYTACDPGNPDWHLRASELEIDDESGRGSATSTTIYFQEIPFIYLPYFQFPIDDRRLSGLLIPTVGYSEANGASLVLPVYWNLAPNYDMTITPVWYDKRGLQLNTENRYLFESGRGQLDLSYLDDKTVDDTRWFRRLQHISELGYDVQGDLLLAESSDGKIFDDFDNIAPEYNNIRHLERRVRFRRIGQIWDSELMWQDYQTLDPATLPEDRPYSRLPRLAVEASPSPWQGGIETPLRTEIASFDREDSITGTRSHLVGSVLWSSEDSWYFFKPGLQLAFTDYQLENNAVDDNIDRALPTLSIDSGLIFERFAGAGDKWRQTLEPRLYFLHTPFEEQNDIPDFDTSLKASTYNNLFTNNRFNGADRIGDASQVSLGLASRLYQNQTGNELMQLRLGQIYYFEDRRVSLDGSTDDSIRSDTIGEFDFWPNERTRIAARLVRDQQSREIDEGEISANYSYQGLAMNLGYYYTQDELEQALVSLVYPLNDRWTLISKVHQSLRFNKPVDNLLGFGYQSCCWGLKILAGQSGDEDENFANTDNSIFFELTLKGLTSTGEDIDSRLKNSIPGYQAPF